MTGLPSLGIISIEVRAEREAMIRHLDAIDSKAGVVLSFAGLIWS